MTIVPDTVPKRGKRELPALIASSKGAVWKTVTNRGLWLVMSGGSAVDAARVTKTRLATLTSGPRGH